MFLYSVIAAVVAVIAGIVIAARAKKAEDAVYTRLDKAGRITNILLIPIYLCAVPFSLFFAFLANPRYDGFLGLLGWIVAVLQASAALPCGIGLGLSAALRKKGKSKQSFAVQFAGFVGIALMFLLFFAFYGNLMSSIN